MMMMNKHDNTQMYTMRALFVNKAHHWESLIWQIDDNIDENRFYMMNCVDRDDD